MSNIKENEKNLPPEVFGAISKLVQSLEKIEEKYIKAPKEEQNENS